jgi:5-methylthioadenosine/S-adenosylhomocysteine deaminase
MGIILRNVRSVLGPSGTLNSRIESNTFATVAEAEIAPQQGDVVIDGSGKLAFSGFVNAHTHLPMVLLRGLADDVPLDVWLNEHVWPIEAKLTPEDVYWCTLLALAEAIRGGTTCVNDMYFHNDAIGKAVRESGLRAVLCYAMIADSLDTKGREEIDATRRLVERWEGEGDGRIRTAVSTHAVYTCGETLWREAVNMAGSFGVPLHTHLAETRQEVEHWKEQTGESPVAYLERIGAFEVPVLAAHCVHVDEADIATMASHDVRVAHCPKSNAKLGSGVAPVPEMRAAGIRVGIGTDGAASNNRLDMIEELRAAWILQRGHHEDPTRLGAADVVAMAVEEGRTALGLPEAKVGVGNVADVVLIDATEGHSWPPHDPVSTLAYAAAASDVTDVIVDGRILMKDGELLTIDEERVQSEVNRRLQRLKT